MGVLNTDQGVQHVCESLGGKPVGAHVNKASIGTLTEEVH